MMARTEAQDCMHSFCWFCSAGDVWEVDSSKLIPTVTGNMKRMGSVHEPCYHA